MSIDRGMAGAAMVMRSVRRVLRRHWLALLMLLVFNFVVFYPSLFMGRIVSPVDILSRYDPFATVRPGVPQNGSLNDIATSYLSLMAMVRQDPASFHWNRYIASGVPGFGSVGAGVLSPFVLLPALLLPFSLFCTGILVLKINVPFYFAYLWLREERLGKVPAAAGAVVLGWSGIVAVWWLWPASNAVALYPALLFLVARMMHGKRISFLFASMLALSFVLSGFPATTAYGAWIAGCYAGFLCWRRRSFPLAQLAKSLVAALVAALIALPLVLPFMSFLRRTGYLVRREHASREMFYPLDHLASFLDPYRLGNPVAHLWYGDARLNASNNFVEATIFMGVAPLLLVLPGLFHKGGRSRWFWFIFAGVVVGGMFGAPLVTALLEELPGVRYSPLTRLRFLLPVPVAYLAACGVGILLRWARRGVPRYARPIGSLVGVALAVPIMIPLAFFAAGFYPYLPPAAASIPVSPSVSFLQSQQAPFRIAPSFNWLFPNSAEYYRLEDVRSHFSSEEQYRRLLQRIDPGAFGSFGTVINFNSLHFNVRDPFVSFLNVRYLIEQPSIDILRWEVEKGAIPSGTLDGEIELPPGGTLRRPLALPAAFGIEVALASVETVAPDAALTISLVRPGAREALAVRRLAGEGLRVSKVYLPVHGTARPSDPLLLIIQSRGVRARLLRSEPIGSGDPVFVRFTTSPLRPSGSPISRHCQYGRANPMRRLAAANRWRLLCDV